eukprot:gnl/MRDRNA2_/MRDRNA2_132313_c0_seq1.p1 gnl/MRDRNA2_/MRDRNA2_132313_c0~~gnl/MRDRNA2_/MRDRNA2_132313_c0_seq1.p1  ORF type:complete len:345 (+),score=41.03 gnl/MRDRNA2_/MRDRNA2_132313_c0_seq1:59-1093(+)
MTHFIRPTTPRWADLADLCESDDENSQHVLPLLFEDSYKGTSCSPNNERSIASQLDNTVCLSEGPTDFSFLMHNSSPAPLHKERAVSDSTCSTVSSGTPSTGTPCTEDEENITKKPQLHLDLVFDENSNSNGKREREGDGFIVVGSRRCKKPKATAEDKCESCECESKQLVKGKGKGKSECLFSHQRCFEWSRKPGGCSEPCPNGRLHVCEYCGSPDHRGCMSDCKADVVNGPDGDGPTDFSFLFKAEKLSPRSPRRYQGKSSGKGKSKSIHDEEKPVKHQRCFDWSRKVDGCSEPCPNGRAHVCEFCGSPEHRGVDCTCQQLSSRAKAVSHPQARKFRYLKQM